MENNIDFIELANYCKKEKSDSSDHNTKWYRGTFYAAIHDDDSMVVSKTPHILKSAKKCILVHDMRYKAVTLTYDCYSVQILNSNGVVTEKDLEDGFRIGITDGRFNYAPEMYIEYQNKLIFRTRYDFNGKNPWEWEKILPDIWKLYLRLKKECVNLHEMEMFCDIVKKGNEIVDLNEKLDQEKYKNQQKDLQIQAYKSLLDEIKKLVEQRHE